MKPVFIWTIFSFNTSLKNINIQSVENCEENFKVLKNCEENCDEIFKILKNCDEFLI